MSKKTPSAEVSARPRPKKGLVRFPYGEATAQAIVEAARAAKDRLLPPAFLVDGDVLSVLSVLSVANTGTNGHALRTDVPVVNESGVRVTGNAELLATEVAKTSRVTGLQFEANRVRILTEDGEAAEGVGGAGIASDHDHSTYWTKRTADLLEVGSLPTSVLRGLLGLTQAFVGNETREQINWMPLDLSPGLVQGVATNGHVLVVRRLWSPLIATTGNLKLGIPQSAVRLLSKLQDPTAYLYQAPPSKRAKKKDDDDDDDTTWMLRCGAQQVCMTHASGFPPYDTLLPSSAKTYVAFDVDAVLLRQVVAEVAARAAKTSKGVVVLSVEDGHNLSLLIGDTALRWVIPVTWVRGKVEPFRSTLKIQYLSMVVRTITQGNVTTRFERASAQSEKEPDIAPLYVSDVPFGDVESDRLDAITALMPMKP